MPDKCTPNECPVAFQVDALGKEFDRYRDNSTTTHKEIFDRLNVLEQSKSEISAKLKGIDEKLDKLIAWREFQDDKPNKLLDKLK